MGPVADKQIRIEIQAGGAIHDPLVAIRAGKELIALSWMRVESIFAGFFFWLFGCRCGGCCSGGGCGGGGGGWLFSSRCCLRLSGSLQKAIRVAAKIEPATLINAFFEIKLWNLNIRQGSFRCCRSGCCRRCCRNPLEALGDALEIIARF